MRTLLFILTMDIGSSSHTKYTSFTVPNPPGIGGLFDITGGGPMEGPPVLGPEAYMWVTGGGTTVIPARIKLKFEL